MSDRQQVTTCARREVQGIYWIKGIILEGGESFFVAEGVAIRNTLLLEVAVKMRIRQASRFLAKGMEASLINLVDLPGKE